MSRHKLNRVAELTVFTFVELDGVVGHGDAAIDDRVAIVIPVQFRLVSKFLHECSQLFRIGRVKHAAAHKFG